MILKVQKILEVPGDLELNCLVGPIEEGWAGEVKPGQEYMRAYKREPGWKFYYPFDIKETIESAEEDWCRSLYNIPHYSQSVDFFNDWVYGMHTFQPFVPLK